MKRIAVLALIAPLALAACGGSGTSQSASAASANVGYGSSSGARTGDQTIGMYNYRFSPKAITGKPGATVKVTLVNKSQTEHNFKIDGQKADADVKPGATATVSVTIPKSGSVQYYCEYHRGLGMTGTVKPS